MFYEYQLQQYWFHNATIIEGLTTIDGQSVRVIHPGLLNLDQGPDFTNARIKIGEVVWVGKIEVHIYTSDWVKHFHHVDSNYQNIILHVVWINDLPEFDVSPIVELSSFLEIDYFLNRLNTTKESVLHCSGEGYIRFDVSKYELLFGLGLNRLSKKKDKVLNYLSENKNDFSVTLWQLVFRSFGRSTNADFFEAIFKSIPIHLLRLYGFDPRKIEALLFGQAGLLDDNFEDDYPRQLKQEFLLLKNRHDLKPVLGTVKFLRMRPRNFPTIRIAQLTAFYNKHMALVNVLLALDEIEDIFQIFEVAQHRYWENHFLFDRLSVNQFKEIGHGLRQQIILNAFIPFLMAYGEHHGQNNQVQKAMHWLSKLKPEQNAIISEFSRLGFCSTSMLDTQFLLELYSSKCLQNGCSECIRGRLLEIKVTN
jgi:hypothetical protein